MNIQNSAQDTNPQPPANEGNDYTAEVRFGVVMYGGVSLAIYINGVANELYEMACATPRSGVALDRSGEAGTREIYRRLSWLVGSPALRQRYRALIDAARGAAAPTGSATKDVWTESLTTDLSRTRLVVDVIAGASAGGINGVFLAKALANGEQFGALKAMWVNEGDIGLLLNDQRSYADLGPGIADRSKTPTSLLNSDRMYAKLKAAMEGMAPLVPTRTPFERGESPLVEEMDLFVTTTDILGAPVPLRLMDKLVYERRYKQSYHFSYPNGVTTFEDEALSGNDFAAGNTAFLAFAARCTSSFPFAFEPMQLSALTRLRVDGAAPGVRRWDAFFPNLPRDEVADGDHVHRAFGDGGYLDNKPFTYVVDALSRRFASVPLERKLIYVEPSPEKLDPHERPDPLRAPDALTNAMAALTSIPRYETIREDLQAVLQRNKRIERVERIVRMGEADLDAQASPFAAVALNGTQVPDWASLKLSDMVRYYGLAFLPYRRLRVYALTDRLADQLAVRWGVDPDSDHQYALRALVRAWRERHFDEEPAVGSGHETVNAFLDQFDVDYRLRRLGFLLRKTDQLTRLFRRRRHGVFSAQAGAGANELSESDARLVKSLHDHVDLLDPALGEAVLLRALDALSALKAGLLDARVALERAQRRMGAASAGSTPDEASILQLRGVLSLLLGDVSAGGAPLTLTKTDGTPVPVVLGDAGLKAASSARSLQESVVYRANALLNAAESAGQTTLQHELEAGLGAMRFKRGAALAFTFDTTLDRIAAQAWTLLGAPGLAAVPGQVQAAVEVQVGPAVSASGHTAQDQARSAALNTELGERLRRFIGEYYLRFDSYDQMSFPLYYDTGTGEPANVDVLRVSPADATHLIDEANDAQHRRKLAGTALANFGAFLDERWRRNDIMWGRLDGAERLIEALLPMSDDDTKIVRDELIMRAHGGILREALVAQGEGALTDLLCKAMEQTAGAAVGAGTGEQLRHLLNELRLGDPVQRERLSSVLLSLMSEQGLMQYVRNDRVNDPDPNPKTTLDSAARAVTITGRLLEGISAEQGTNTVMPRWLARVGLLLQGIVAVSLPGTLKQRWWTHGLKVLYAFEAAALVFALLFGSADARSVAVTAIIVTVAAHLVSLMAGDLMRERRGWIKLLVGAMAAAVLALALAGVIGLRQLGMGTLLCGVPDAYGNDEDTGWVCRAFGR